MDAVTADMNSDYQLPGCKFTAPTGKQFDKWDKGAVGTVIKITEDITLKAIWKDLSSQENETQPDKDDNPQPPETDDTNTKVNGTTISDLQGGKKSITVIWNIRNDVDGYDLQCATDKNFKKNLKSVTISNAKTASTTIKKLGVNKKYYVRIRTYKKSAKTRKYSGWSKVKSVKTAMAEKIDAELEGSSITKLKADKGAVKVTWTVKKGIKGYDIQYSLDKNLRKTSKQ